MGKNRYIKKQKSKEKDGNEDYSFYIPRLPSMKKRFKRGTVIALFIILVSWSLWFLFFMYYPLTTMINIEGKVVDFKTCVYGSRSTGMSYIIQLDCYASPIRFEEYLSLLHWSRISMKEVVGDYVTVQIQKKNLKKLDDNTIKLDEYREKQLLSIGEIEISKLPRFYGIKRQNEVIVSSPKALWYTPSGLGILFQTICFSLTLIAITDRYYKGQELYKINQWVKANT